LQISNGKVLVDDPNFDRSRETKPIIGNMYQYTLFPMLFIFILICFAALFDDMTFKLFGRRKRTKAFFLGCAILITAITVEDFAWFVNRFVLPLKDDPKGRTINASYRLDFDTFRSNRSGQFCDTILVLGCCSTICHSILRCIQKTRPNKLNPFY
jgi:hypothetical protein